MTMAPAETLSGLAQCGSRHLRVKFAGGATLLPRGVGGSKKRGIETGVARADTSVVHLPTCKIFPGSSAVEQACGNTRWSVVRIHPGELYACSSVVEHSV